MVETKVPKDIRSYKTKIIGPLSLRQLICLILAVILDGLAYFVAQSLDIKLSINLIIYGVMFLDLPILAFMIEVEGLALEVYLQKILFKQFSVKTKRVAETRINTKPELKPMSKKELKNYQNKQKSIQRKHPELKSYE